MAKVFEEVTYDWKKTWVGEEINRRLKPGGDPGTARQNDGYLSAPRGDGGTGVATTTTANVLRGLREHWPNQRATYLRVTDQGIHEPNCPLLQSVGLLDRLSGLPCEKVYTDCMAYKMMRPLRTMTDRPDTFVAILGFGGAEEIAQKLIAKGNDRSRVQSLGLQIKDTVSLLEEA